MTRLRPRTYIAEISITDSRRIVREAVVVSHDVEPRIAKKLVFKKACDMSRRPGRFMSITPLEGFYYEGKIRYSSEKGKKGSGVIRRHERFHESIGRKGLEEQWDAMVMEESAAYAWQSIGAYKNRSDDLEAAKDARRYAYFAVHCVRFLHALALQKPNGLLTRSVDSIVRKARNIQGDPMAIAFNYAKDLSFFLECLSILRCWGASDGKRVLTDAIEIANAGGLSEAREFLYCHLGEHEVRFLKSAYGKDADSLESPSLYSRRLKDELLLLTCEAGRPIYTDIS